MVIEYDLVGGLDHVFFPYIGNNYPNWLIFFRGVGIAPTSDIMIEMGTTLEIQSHKATIHRDGV